MARWCGVNAGTSHVICLRHVVRNLIRAACRRPIRRAPDRRAGTLERDQPNGRVEDPEIAGMGRDDVLPAAARTDHDVASTMSAVHESQ